ncbi:cytochrome P450 [Coniophora puteana RWD-64-598 SS2]|uniref:Cytochrome P450 n=1 Tax=Coniophora puteana (strain RWD-64-598) TaxID=741705 RepID=A0A5M3MAX7_CONPW|nr:cytochrome P450 [Coniophora puteana RWD-64-598 SS2]EIW75950.1 cytochrome P450 [Coniophora puteana RWD-64-598 SS2]
MALPLVSVPNDVSASGHEQRSPRAARCADSGLANDAKAPFPPGPPGVPLLGNTLAIDAEKPYETFEAWTREYGDLVYCRLFGQDTLVVGSESVARDLLERRSSNFSDKTMLGAAELLGLDRLSAFVPHTDHWRLHRRVFHQAIRQDAVARYRPAQLRAAHELCRNIFLAPRAYVEHLTLHAGAIILATVYGYDVSGRHDDAMLAIIERANEHVTGNGTPFVFAIFEAFPSLARIPKWLGPVGSLARLAHDSNKYVSDMVEVPFVWVRKTMSEGYTTVTSSMVSDSLRKFGDEDGAVDIETEKAIKGSAAAAFTAGTETTFAVIQIFILAMIRRPDVQRRLHAQLDAAVGSGSDGRLPTFEDRPQLPLLDAVLRETLRWRPVVPVNLPHGVSEDDVYEGCFIPGGADVIVNTHAILHDSVLYPSPDTFNPDRFLDPSSGALDDTSAAWRRVSLAFGLGRRVCPGRHLAEGSIWAAMASLLAVFEFGPPRDEHGKEVEFDVKWTSGMVRRPLPFPCEIKPRYAGVLEKIEAELM